MINKYNNLALVYITSLMAALSASAQQFPGVIPGSAESHPCYGVVGPVSFDCENGNSYSFKSCQLRIDIMDVAREIRLGWTIFNRAFCEHGGIEVNQIDGRRVDTGHIQLSATYLGTPTKIYFNDEELRISVAQRVVTSRSGNRSNSSASGSSSCFWVQGDFTGGPQRVDRFALSGPANVSISDNNGSTKTICPFSGSGAGTYTYTLRTEGWDRVCTGTVRLSGGRNTVINAYYHNCSLAYVNEM